MNSKRQWIAAWVAASVIWLIYWVGMTLMLGLEAIREVVADLGAPLLVGALYVSLPVCLYALGALIASIVVASKTSKK